MFSIFKAFKSKQSVYDNFYNLEANTSWLAISYNEEPKFGLIQQELNFIVGQKSFSAKAQQTADKFELILNENGPEKSFSFDQERTKELRKFEAFKQVLIKNHIQESIDKLKLITPNSLPEEDKAWEWYRVSMDVLMNGLKKIDATETLLQYKLFWGIREGKYLARVIIYNLDIEIVFLDKGINVTVYNNKPGEEAYSTPAHKVIITGLYNDYFNKLIEVLAQIKKVEDLVI